jgi:hypothetical protein
LTKGLRSKRRVSFCLSSGSNRTTQRWKTDDDEGDDEGDDDGDDHGGQRLESEY